MNRKKIRSKAITAAFLVLLALLPAGAVPLPVGERGGGLAAPPDPRQERTFHPFPGGLEAENGHIRVEVSAWGMRFTPYLEGVPRPEAALGFRLLEVRRGDALLYVAPPEGVPPQRQERPDRAGYARSDRLVEVYQALDFAVEQSFLFPQALPGEGDLVLTGLLSTTLRPEAEGQVGQARFPLEGGVEAFYGPAVVRDDAGRESPVELHLVGNEVRLVVPGAWLEEAAYPVVVDPLLGVETNVTAEPHEQVTPAVATSDLSDDNKRFLAVWADDRLGNWDIWAQTLKTDGTPLANTLITVTSASGAQQEPAVVYNPNDDDYGNRYLVVWRDGRSDAGDIYGQRILADTGVPFGVLITISLASGAQVAPAVAFDPDPSPGYYLVAWEDYRDPDGNGDIYVRRIRADGMKDPEYLVAGGPLAQSAPAVAYDRTNGRWLVVWQQNGDIYARACAPDGNPGEYTPIPVAQTATAEQFPDLAYNVADDEFLVVWEAGSIWGRRLAWQGSDYGPVGGSVPLSPKIGIQSWRYPRVTYGANTNEYTVVWQYGNAVEARQVSNAAEAMANLWTVSGAPYDPLKRQVPVVTYNPLRNQYLVVWQGEGLSGDGVLSNEIFVRRLDNSAITRDGGEQGDVAYASQYDRYLLVWRWNDGISLNIYGYLVSATGNYLSAELTICQAANHQNFPAVAYSSADGRFLVVWEDERNDGGDIYGREVFPDGSMGNEFPIQVQSGPQERPALAYDSATGNFLVVWEDRSGADYDVDGALVDLSPRTVTLLPDIAAEAGDEREPEVAANPSHTTNRFLVVWEWNGSLYGRFMGANGEYGSSLGNLFPSVGEPAVAWGPAAGVYLLVGRQTSSPNRAVGRFIQPDGATENAFEISGESVSGPADHRELLGIAASNQTNEFMVSWAQVTDFNWSSLFARRVAYPGGGLGQPFIIWPRSPIGGWYVNSSALAARDMANGARYLTIWWTKQYGGGSQLYTAFLFFPPQP